MKQTILLFTIFCFLSVSAFAGKPKLIGAVNMISTRNIDSSAEYVLLHRATNDSKKAFKSLRGDNIDEAVNNAVSDIPGGEYLLNVKIYFDGKDYAVIGDVWGIAANQQIEGFAVGDVAFIKNSLTKQATGKSKFTQVTITGLKDRKSCLVKFPDGKIKEVEYTELSETEG